MHSIFYAQCRAWNGKVGSTMVNSKYCIIFNGIFESQKSSKIKKTIAKMREKYTACRRVYHTIINHNGCVGERNDLLGREKRRHL